MEEVPTGYEAEGLASDRCSLVLDYPSEVFIGGRGAWTDFSCIISKRRVVRGLVGARQLPDGMDETVNLFGGSFVLCRTTNTDNPMRC